MTKLIKTSFTIYNEGTIPVIISAPHGGFEKPNFIPNRKKGVFDKDENTFELTKEIEKEFYRQIKQKPYSIKTTLSRTKIDFNRNEKNAFEDIRAKDEYETYHNSIKKARNEVEKIFGKGLFIDIHGQSHPEGFIEFGYLLDNDILKLDDKKLITYDKFSSIKTLKKFSSKNFLEQLKGEDSLGTLMSKKGFKSIPSKEFPYAKDDNYFEGAFNTLKYGSLDNTGINAIQVEFPFVNCRDTEENIKKCAKAFVASVIKFFETHLDLNLNVTRIVTFK